MLNDAPLQASRTPDAQNQPEVNVREDKDGLAVAFSGNWTTRRVHFVDHDVRALEARGDTKKMTLDISGIQRIDTAGAWLVERLLAANATRGVETTVVGESEAAGILLHAVAEATRGKEAPAAPASDNILIRFLATLGRGVYAARDDFIAGMYILGVDRTWRADEVGSGHAVNLAAIVTQIDSMGIGAVPVVVLMSTIIGAIIAQQGAFQLRYFGAEIFVVDLVGILVLREIGVLLTAIMIAGRSGSAITAEIGSMKMREETDALTVIGLNPVGVLVFPRLVALVIALPLLTITADFAALGGQSQSPGLIPAFTAMLSSSACAQHRRFQLSSPV